MAPPGGAEKKLNALAELQTFPYIHTIKKFFRRLNSVVPALKPIPLRCPAR